MLQLYKNIKSRRLELNLTQSDLAKKMGYADKSMIAKIEKGAVDLTQSKIVAFADALQTTPSELMGWKVLSDEEIANVFHENMQQPLISDADRAKLFSGANAVFDEIFGDILEKEQMEELTRRVQAQLPSDFGMPKTTTLAAHFDGDEFTESELEEIKQFAEFVKNRKK